ncbi:MAG TPA: hypothetical protein VFD91_02125, partial [Mariniphaga sp.]|nr:hypothetical protein [Mariniphaga sp.]
MNRYSFLIFALSFFIVAAISEYRLLNSHPENYLINDFKKQLYENEQDLHDRIDETARYIADDSFDGNFGFNLKFNSQTLEEDGIGILVFLEDSLIYWSDRSIAFFNNTSDFPDNGKLIQLPNGYYMVEALQVNDYQILGFHLIKYNYPHENKYLENKFFEDYRLPPEYELITGSPDDIYPVFNLEDEYLFSINPGGIYLCTTEQLYFPGILYLIGLLILLYYFNREFVASRSSFLVKISTLALVLFMVYAFHLIFHTPKVFLLMRFFSPSVFALNDWLPSLGDFFMLALFFLYWLYHFGRYLNIAQIHKDVQLSRKAVGVLLLLFSSSTYLLVHYYVYRLVFNSTISFSLNRIIEISSQSVFAILSVGLLLLAVFFLTIRIIDQLRNDFRLGHVVVVAFLITVFLGAIQYIIFRKVSVEALSLFVAATLLATLFSKNYLYRFTISYLIIFVAAASVYSLIVFYNATAN